MTGEAKIAIGIVVSLGVALGVGFTLAAPAGAPALPPAPPPPPDPTPTVRFVRTTGTVPKGVAVAMAIAPSDLATVAAAMGTTRDVDGLATMLQGSTSPIPALIGTHASTVYAPGTQLPDAWPPDDPAPQTEYHAAFVAGAAFAVSSFPIPALVWTGALVTHP